MQTEPLSQLSASCPYQRMSARKGILDLLRRTEPKLLGCCDLDRLARGRITALTRRTVLDLEPAKARKVDLFTLLRRINDAREYRFNGLLGHVLLHACIACHVINQVGCLHSGVPLGNVRPTESTRATGCHSECRSRAQRRLVEFAASPSSPVCPRLRRCHRSAPFRAGLYVGTSVTEGATNFPVNR